MVDKSIPSYVYMFEEVMYYKLVAPPIQKGWLHKLIQKIDCKVWPRRLGRLGDGWLLKTQS